MSDQKLGWRDPPPADLAKEVYDELFPAKPPRPPPRTLYDNLPEGLTDADPAMPGLQKPEPLVLYKERKADELVPAATRLWRVGLNDLPQLGWLIERLMQHSPHIPAHSWQSQLIQYMTSDHCCFRRSERAVGLATFTTSPFHPHCVEVMFLLHTDLGPEGGSKRASLGEKDCIAIARAMIEWGRHQGAQEVRRLNAFTDLPPSVFRNDLKAEMHEEVRVPIR